MTKDGIPVAEIVRATGISTYRVRNLQIEVGLRAGAGHGQVVVVKNIPTEVMERLSAQAKIMRLEPERLALRIICGCVLKKRMESTVRGVELD